MHRLKTQILGDLTDGYRQRNLLQLLAKRELDTHLISIVFVQKSIGGGIVKKNHLAKSIKVSVGLQ